MKARQSFFCRVFHSFMGILLAVCVTISAMPAFAASESIPTEKSTLEPILTYQLLDKLAAEHGKVILVNFFASFCGPCRREIPELIQLRKEFSEQDLVIIGIAIDQDIRDAASFVDELGVAKAYPVYYGGEDLARSYRISAIPFNVIYNREGRIEVSEAGYIPSADMKKFLQDLIRR